MEIFSFGIIEFKLKQWLLYFGKINVLNLFEIRNLLQYYVFQIIFFVQNICFHDFFFKSCNYYSLVS